MTCWPAEAFGKKERHIIKYRTVSVRAAQTFLFFTSFEKLTDLQISSIIVSNLMHSKLVVLSKMQILPLFWLKELLTFGKIQVISLL
jgi:hypothetical protein